MNYRKILKMIDEHKVQFLELKFTDLPGRFHHISLPVSAVSEDLFSNGLGFDGSSISGFAKINESDLLLRPDASTAFIDPFMDDVTLSFLCNVKNPATSQYFSRDPRFVADKAFRYLDKVGVADTAYFAPEAEFYIFDHVRFSQTANEAFHHIDSEEGFWNSGREAPNLGYRPRFKGGYFPAPPVDSLQNLRAMMTKVMMDIGIEVEMHHHEVGTGGQSEICIKYGKLVRTADNLMIYKYVVKNVAHRYKKTATFMPKPIFQDNGSGMHVHQSLWHKGTNLFFDPDGYGGLSELARHYVGGLLHHAPSLLAICAPTTNSYRRLVPGYEAPIYRIYSKGNRSACVRIPMYSASGPAKRIEFRPPDPSCNPYLAFAAMLMAGLDGILNRIEPPLPIDKNLYQLSPEEREGIAEIPGSLDEAISALEADHDYLLRGDVFTEDLLSMWTDYKRTTEIDFVKLRPHPAEFSLYYDV